MRVLIIGGTAFTGPHVARRLFEMGHELTLFHRGRSQADLPPTVRHILGDRQRLADFSDELKRFAPHLVLDMIPLSEADAQQVMELFRGIAERVIAISSQDVYWAYGRLIGTESGPATTAPLQESSPLRTRLYPYRERVDPDHRLYHYDKILVERAIMGLSELPGTILRFPMVYGPGDRQHRLYPYLKRMDDRRPAILLGQTMAHWRWTRGYVEDMADAVVLAVTNPRAAGQIYNVGQKEAMSEAEWVVAIGRAAGWRGEVITLPEESLPEQLKPGIDPEQHLVVDTTRIRQELGYRETISLDESLERTIAWERTNPPEAVDPKVFDYATEDSILAQVRGKSGGLGK